MAPPSTLTDRERCAIVLLGHGSREQQANHDFELLAQSLRAAWPKHHVIHAYVELARPSLAEALVQAATLCNRVVVLLPCFLFAAGHIKNDLMKILGRDDPAERQHELAELGEASTQPGPGSVALRSG